MIRHQDLPERIVAGEQDRICQESCHPFRNQTLKDLPGGEEFFLECRLDLTAYEELHESQGREQNGQNQAGKGQENFGTQTTTHPPPHR